MKKIWLTAFSFCLALSFSACSDDSSSTEPQKSQQAADEEDNDPSGGFSAFLAIDKDAKEILKGGLEGTGYESAVCDSFATQVVAGTNYKFQCSIKDGKKTKDVVLTVFEPLPSSKLSIQLTRVVDADGEILFEAEVPLEEDENDESGDSEKGGDSDTMRPAGSSNDSEKSVSDETKIDCDGCYGGFDELTDADMKIFEQANKISDSTFVQPTAVSKQVVAGTNYKFLCGLVESEGKVEDETVQISKLVFLTVYVNLKGEVSIMSVEEAKMDPADADESDSMWVRENE